MLRVHNFVVSLDGYSAGEGLTTQAAFGHAQQTFLDWLGWWGEEPPFRTPCFVLTHWDREPLVLGSTTFHFVSGSPAQVLKLAAPAC